MTEKEKAEKTQHEINSLVEHAQITLSDSMARALLALEDARKTLSEAGALATRFNRVEAHSLVLSEEFHLECPRSLPGLLDAVRIVTGPTAPMPGVKVRLSQSLTLRDFPQGSVAVLPKEEAADLIRRSPPLAVVVD